MALYFLNKVSSTISLIGRAFSISYTYCVLRNMLTPPLGLKWTKLEKAGDIGRWVMEHGNDQPEAEVYKQGNENCKP
jgi:hypothetical protein